MWKSISNLFKPTPKLVPKIKNETVEYKNDSQHIKIENQIDYQELKDVSCPIITSNTTPQRVSVIKQLKQEPKQQSNSDNYNRCQTFH